MITQLMEGLQETSLLKPVGSIVIPARNRALDPEVFFQSRCGLHVRSSFRERILPALRSVRRVPERRYGTALIKQELFDREVRSGLRNPFRAHWEDLAFLIEKQTGGIEGPLLTSGAITTLYLKGMKESICSLELSWCFDGQEWCIGEARRSEDIKWQKGGQILYFNAE